MATPKVPTIGEVFDFAYRHAKESGNASALLRYEDAVRLSGEYADNPYAYLGACRALNDSLRHSVGMFHPDRVRAGDLYHAAQIAEVNR